MTITSPRSASAERPLTAPSDAANHHFRSPLPRGLRDVACALSWDNFRATYACAGDLRLGSWTAHPGHGGLTDYHATIDVGPRKRSLRESATGPIAALTAMLHALGRPVEIITLHHQRTDDGFASFVLCDLGGIKTWGLGLDDAAESANVRAMISAVNRLG